MNNLGIVKRNIVRADKAAVARLAKLGVATIHEAMGRVGLMKPYMRPVYKGANICGTAPGGSLKVGCAGPLNQSSQPGVLMNSIAINLCI